MVNSEGLLESYGTCVKTSGIDTDLFQKNSVMFYNHDRTTMPIGRWDYIAKEGNTLVVGDPVFHLGDYTAERVLDKVELGFIKAISMRARRLVFDPNGVKTYPEQKYPDIVSCEILEVSYTDIPVASESTEITETVAVIELCDDDGNALKLSDPDVFARFFPQNHVSQTGADASKPMDKSIYKELNLSESATDEAVLSAIQGLKKQNQAAAPVPVPEYVKEVLLSQAEMAGINTEAMEPLKKLAEKAPEETAQLLKNLKLSQSEYQGGALGQALEQIGGAKPQEPAAAAGNKPSLLNLSQGERKGWDLDRWEKEDPKGIQELNLSYPDEYVAILQRSGMEGVVVGQK